MTTTHSIPNIKTENKPSRGACIADIYAWFISEGVDVMSLEAHELLCWVDGKIHINAARILRDLRNKATAADRLAKKRNPAKRQSKGKKKFNNAEAVARRETILINWNDRAEMI